MGRKKKLKKEEIAEDWCFVCKDGGLLMVCEYKDCLKAYHADCVGKDDSFLETGNYQRCSWHNCFLCCKTSKFQCFCCPNAVCGSCFCDAEFSIVKGNKGFCSYCLRLARLVEEDADVASDGEKIDFKDPETYEFLFSDYYKTIKEKEGWNTLQVHSAYKLLNNGKHYKCDWDLYDIGEEDDDSGESEDNFIVSDHDDLSDTAAVKPVQKWKSHKTKLETIKGKTKDKKKEFIGWCSRSLIEFLDHIGRDTSKVLSQHDVASIIIEYCKENKLFHPEKKRKVLCNAKLKCLLGRKSVNRNSIFNLLTRHFTDNFEEMEDDMTICSEDTGEDESIKCQKQRKLSSSTASHEDLVSEAHQSCFAAIVTSNIKLVYLKRSLIEELLTQPETFDGKVIGNFVRVKSDPNDYLQKNSHQLLQVVGIKRPSEKDEINKEILLHLSNVPIYVPISKLSDDDFSEEECQDLCQRMKNDMLLQPTVLELEQKARSLHEDIIKHWIPRELARLQRCIDQANEKGWRRELYEYMERKLLLQTESEQSRLLNDSPKVIPEVVYTKPSQELEDFPSKDKLVKNGLPNLVLGEDCSPLENYSKIAAGPPQKTPATTDQDGRISASVEQSSFTTAVVQEKATLPSKQLQSTSKVRQINSKNALSEELSLEPLTCITTSQLGPPQPRHTDSGSGFDGRKLDAAMNSEQMIKEKKQSMPVSGPLQPRHTDSGSGFDGRKSDAAMNSEQKIKEKNQSMSGSDIIILSDDNEQEANIQSQKQTVENPENCIWHCVGPYGEKRGPYSMSLLKRWSEAYPCASKFNVWKTGQSETEAILLTDALRQFLPKT